ncbi:hypothetical protein SASPL_125893 [Salvia splendens]|uniref:Uncharacterized protein n=1 Tax=Salvia splendens TaxID=180675 RepID=A0A8X8ZQ96_SALSN|nr:hypothetical protein SASPL_125893 [Salvia splendens]
MDVTKNRVAIHDRFRPRLMWVLMEAELHMVESDSLGDVATIDEDGGDSIELIQGDTVVGYGCLNNHG